MTSGGLGCLEGDGLARNGELAGGQFVVDFDGMLYGRRAEAGVIVHGGDAFVRSRFPRHSGNE